MVEGLDHHHHHHTHENQSQTNRCFVEVDSDKLVVGGAVFLGELLEDGRNLLARAAPRSIVVNSDVGIGGQDRGEFVLLDDLC